MYLKEYFFRGHGVLIFQEELIYNYGTKINKGAIGILNGNMVSIPAKYTNVNQGRGNLRYYPDINTFFKVRFFKGSKRDVELIGAMVKGHSTHKYIECIEEIVNVKSDLIRIIKRKYGIV